MEDCIFCSIAEGKIPSEKVYEDSAFLAFRDINPQSPVHILVIPKRHIERLSHCGSGEVDVLGGLVATANRVAADMGISEDGYRVTVNSGKNGGQLVPHLHLHLMGGAVLSDKMA